MNKSLLLPLLALAILASCGQSSEKTEAQPGFSISMDTVQVDSKGEILFLNYFLGISSLDKDQKFLYNMNAREYVLEKINLEKLSLDSLMKLEKEGPNGIGSFLNTLIALDNGGFVFSSGYTVNYLDANGNKTRQITLEREPFIKDLLPSGKSINIQSFGISKDGRFMAAFYDNSGIGQKPDGIIWMDINNNTGKIIPTDAFDFITDNNITLELDGNLAGGVSGLAFVEPHEDKIIFSPSSRNRLMIYDLNRDTLITKKYESKLTSDETKPGEAKTVTSIEEFDELREEYLKEVTFGRWQLDQKTGNRWRFSKELDRTVGEDSLIFKTVLTGIDENFEMLGEAKLPEEFAYPNNFWIREGMIYTFLNIDDELAFIRIKPTFDNE